MAPERLTIERARLSTAMDDVHMAAAAVSGARNAIYAVRSVRANTLLALDAAVAVMRSEGASWAAVAESLGLSEDDARARFEQDEDDDREGASITWIDTPSHRRPCAG